jgi:hypothetical protein
MILFPMAKDVSYENEILSFTLILFTEQEETNININIKPLLWSRWEIRASAAMCHFILTNAVCISLVHLRGSPFLGPSSQSGASGHVCNLATCLYKNSHIK